MNQIKTGISDFILAIDPGTSKIGVAMLNLSGNVIKRRIIRDDISGESILEFIENHTPEIIVVGDGTGSDDTIKILKNVGLGGIPLRIIDETESSEEARKEFWDEMSSAKRSIMTIAFAFGLIKVEIDDLVAVILGRRYLLSR